MHWSTITVTNMRSYNILEERLYAELWERDRSAKCAREEIETALQMERNREMLKVSTCGFVLIHVVDKVCPM